MVQEIISNMVIKHGTMKIYDRAEWLYLTKVQKKLGFNEIIVDIVNRLVGNNLYSVLLNGQRKGFFRSYRGLNQGDPQSPSFFILVADLMSRSLKSLALKRSLRCLV